MSRYEVYLFLHVAAAIMWIGVGMAVAIFTSLAHRAKDDVAFARLVAIVSMLGQRLFIPASLSVLIFGILMVADGPWEFDQLWIVIGLVGYAATFLTGILVLEPRAKKIAALTEANGGVMSPGAILEARKLLMLMRIDYTVLWVVVADMTLKPTGDDAGLLVLMAAAVVAGTVWTLQGQKRIDAEAGAAPAVATA